MSHTVSRVACRRSGARARSGWGDYHPPPTQASPQVALPPGVTIDNMGPPRLQPPPPAPAAPAKATQPPKILSASMRLICEDSTATYPAPELDRGFFDSAGFVRRTRAPSHRLPPSRGSQRLSSLIAQEA